MWKNFHVGFHGNMEQIYSDVAGNIGYPYSLYVHSITVEERFEYHLNSGTCNDTIISITRIR